MLATVIIMGVQLTIGDIIRSNVQNNTALTITSIFNDMERQILEKCDGSVTEDNCKNDIKINKYNASDKFKIAIQKDNTNTYEIFAIYRRSDNEYGSIEPLVKRTASIYGYSADGKIVSVLGNWETSPTHYQQFGVNENGQTVYYFYKKVFL
ncbi:Uncharacterised protein [Escherichia coli]|nr:Uncharacterised protein [Escherichia coli]